MNEVKNVISSGQYGWICPRCGRVNSPYTETCPCYRSMVINSVSASNP